ncbi:MAG: hypothetical protein ACHRHE_12085 [Tepidisphaerales bacterium]
MLLQTNSYVVPRDKRHEHARLMKRFMQIMARLGCERFEVYEQVGPGWTAAHADPRYIQIIRFRDRKQHQALQEAERNDPQAQQLIREFCDLIGFDQQQQQGQFSAGYYGSVVTAPAEPAGDVPGAAG